MDHISTDELELYSTGQTIDASALVRIEQHCSKCQECADRLLAIGRFVSLVKSGAIRVGSGYAHLVINSGRSRCGKDQR